MTPNGSLGGALGFIGAGIFDAEAEFDIDFGGLHFWRGSLGRTVKF